MIKLLSPKRKNQLGLNESSTSHSNPTSVMATRHGVSHLHNARLCSRLARHKLARQHIGYKHCSLFMWMSRRHFVLRCESKFVLFSLLKDEAAKNQWLKCIFLHCTTAVQPQSLCSCHFTDDCFSNLWEFNVGFTKHLLLKDGSVPSLFGPAGSTESKPVSMINNRCLYFLSSIQNMELWQWAYPFRHALYAVDQSQQTGPSDQSEQSRLTERMGLVRVNLRIALNKSLEN